MLLSDAEVFSIHENTQGFISLCYAVGL